MKILHQKSGFTIIEVSLFLALSGLLMIGLIVGANASISRQRYNDSVNSIGDYLRNVYADAINVSNDKNVLPDSATYTGPGRSTTAIYGKLITFGEPDASGHPASTIYSYDIVGNAISSADAPTQSILSMLKSSPINANIVSTTCSGVCTNTFYRMTSYQIPWEAKAQKPNIGNSPGNPTSELFTGAILVVRSPTTGGLHTYVYTGTVDFHSIADGSSNGANTFSTFLNTKSFTENQLDFCVDSDDNSYSNRRNIRILSHANNSTGVLLVGLDADDSKCLGHL